MKAIIREQLKENAQRAATKRWSKERELNSVFEFDWENEPLEICRERVARLLVEYQNGARWVQVRVGNQQAKLFKCDVCGRDNVRLPSGIFAYHDPTTGEQRNYIACSPECNSRKKIPSKAQ